VTGQISTDKWEELWSLYEELKDSREWRMADKLFDANWVSMVAKYPDLTAEEIASAVCGGGVRL